MSIVPKYRLSENWFSYSKSKSLIILVIGHIKTYLKYTRGLLNDYRVHAYWFELSEIWMRQWLVVHHTCHKTVFDINLTFENHRFLISWYIVKPHDWYLEVTLIIFLEIEICKTIEFCIQSIIRYWHFISFNQWHSAYYTNLRWYWFRFGQRKYRRWL